MKLSSVSSNTVWLWLSLFCFSGLLCMTFVEMYFLYPKNHPYFDNSGTLTDRQLSARSRSYLYKSLELISAADTYPNKQALQNLDIAYSLLNINYYVKNYPCTTPSLNKIDLLARQISNQTPPDIALFTRTIVPVLQCAEHIQTVQDNKRTETAVEMLEDINIQRSMLFWGAFLMLAATVVFWLMHLRHSKVITLNRKETHKWIRHAMQDSLTNIPNRRAFDADLASYVECYLRYGHSFSLLMCDIDYFKQYNDALGHIEGDKALKHVAQYIAKNLRDSDNLYRYGGEELAIIFPNTDCCQAQHMGLRILELLPKLQLPHPTSEFGFITMSIGCAAIHEIDGVDGNDLVKLADKRLYTAKQNGRYRLVYTDNESITDVRHAPSSFSTTKNGNTPA